MTAPVTSSGVAFESKKADWLFRFCVAWMVIVIFACVVGPWLPFVDDPRATTGTPNQGPSLDHWFGTSRLGRDVFAQVLIGGRIALRIAAIGTVVGIVLGGFLGLIAGFFRGAIDTIVSLVIAVALSIPALVLVIFFVAVRGQSEANVLTAICILAVPALARIVRASTLQVTEREFVNAARVIGAKNFPIVFREILPNVMPTLVSFAFLTTGIILVAESSLAFLGLSVEQPNITWGSVIAEGRVDIRQTPHMVFAPAFLLFLTVLSLNFIGDHLLRKFDVRETVL